MHTNVLRPGWRAFRDLGKHAPKSARRESFPCQPGAVEIRRNSESPESLATRCQDALGMTVWCCMRSVEFTPLQRSSS